MEPLLVDNVVNLLTLERHINVCHIQRIGDGSRDRRSGPDRAGLTNALHAKRVNCRQRHCMIQLELWEFRSDWHGVVHKGAGEKLTIFAILDSLPHRLSNALRDTAMNLPLYEQGVDLATAVVNGNEASQFYIAGRFIYLNNGDMRTKREDTGFWLKEDCCLETRLNARGQRIGEVRSRRYISKGHGFLWRTSNGELAILKSDIRWARFQHM